LEPHQRTSKGGQKKQSLRLDCTEQPYLFWVEVGSGTVKKRAGGRVLKSVQKDWLGNAQ